MEQVNQPTVFTFQTLSGIYEACRVGEETIQETILRVMSDDTNINCAEYIVYHQAENYKDNIPHFYVVILDKNGHIQKQINDLYESKINSNAFKSLEYYLNCVCRVRTPEAMVIVEKYVDKLTDQSWENLSSNPMAVNLLEQYPEKINLLFLCRNSAATNLLYERISKLNHRHWEIIFSNDGLIDIIKENTHLLGNDIYFWRSLSSNSRAIDILLQNFDKINWETFSRNLNAIPILRQHVDKVNWDYLPLNPSDDTIPFMLENLDKLSRACWTKLSAEKGINHILEENIDKVNWSVLCANKDAAPILKKYIKKEEINLHINWNSLSKNGDISILEENLDKVIWGELTKNEDAIPLLEKNLGNIVWREIGYNESKDLVQFIKKYLYYINGNDWWSVSRNKNLIEIIEKNIKNVDWISIGSNDAAVHILGAMIDFIVSKENTEEFVESKKRKSLTL